MITLLLIRHGRTDWLGKRLAGRLPGISLNAEGRAEAEVLAAGLARVKLTSVYSSPLERTQETAAAVASRCGLPVYRADSLQELDFGEWAGKSFDELGGMEGWRERLRKPSETRFPGGESLGDVHRRGVAWAEEIRTRGGDARIAAFSHADTIRLVLAHYLGMPVLTFQSLTVETASISILQFGEKDPRVLGVNWPACAAGELANI
jgi:broad specificity phosphatase PhoE